VHARACERTRGREIDREIGTKGKKRQRDKKIPKELCDLYCAAAPPKKKKKKIPQELRALHFMRCNSYTGLKTLKKIREKHKKQSTSRASRSFLRCSSSSRFAFLSACIFFFSFQKKLPRQTLTQTKTKRAQADTNRHRHSITRTYMRERQRRREREKERDREREGGREGESETHTHTHTNRRRERDREIQARLK
jgi:hypothetical protein